MAVEFVHLHVHSQYSLLDGAVRVKDLASRAKALGMGAVPLTDHGNMFGILQHILACKEQGLQSILRLLSSTPGTVVVVSEEYHLEPPPMVARPTAKSRPMPSRAAQRVSAKKTKRASA